MAFAFLPSTVVPEDYTSVRQVQAAVAITAGSIIRKDNTGKLFIADSAVGTTDDVEGIALATVAINQPLVYAPVGTYVVVSGLTPGQTYYLGGGADAGKVGLFADADTANVFGTIVGAAYAATRFFIIGRNLDVQL